MGVKLEALVTKVVEEDSKLEVLKKVKHLK
jgi:hypothetical protein